MELCCQCNKYPISNKKHKTCLYCERVRKGKDPFPNKPIKLSQKSIDKMLKNRLEKSKQKKSINTPIKVKTPLKRLKTNIKQVSSKQSKINIQLCQVYQEITQERDEICQGCGKKLPLSFSHTISRKKRPDLQTHKENIELECFGSSTSCHDIWEHLKYPQVLSLLNFERKLLYIQKADSDLYEQIKIKLDDKRRAFELSRKDSFDR